jgi:iron complex transport system ATP-binding protein
MNGLRAERVSFSYAHGNNILAETNLLVERGIVTGLAGPNGSGKSTMLRILCGILAQQSGAVILDGKPLNRHTALDRARKIGFLPQNVSPSFDFTVFEVVCLGRFPHQTYLGGLTQIDRDIAMRCMEAADVVPLRDRPLTSLSGGERQRVLLASVLAQEPGFLLLDEPTSALDLHHQVEILSLLKRLASEGYGVCVVMHDLTLAGRFCDSLSLLSPRQKNVIASGTPRDVLTEPLLREAYGDRVRVCDHPITGTPLVTVEHEERPQ